MKALHLLLIDALLLDAEQAHAAWREWRAQANLDRLDPSSFRLLPSLASRAEPWLAEDPQRDILMGICRRGWSQTQMRRKVLPEVVSILQTAGVRAQPAGPADWADRYWPPGTLRSIETISIDVAPENAGAAIQALAHAGWTREGRNPGRSWFWLRFAPPVRLRNAAGIEARVHWRGLPNTDIVVPELGALKVRGDGPEHDLLRVLGGEYGDGLHWSCDAAMICRRSVRWDEVARLLRWRYLAKSRLQESQPALAGRMPLGLDERVLTSPLRLYRHLRTRLHLP